VLAGAVLAGAVLAGDVLTRVVLLPDRGRCGTEPYRPAVMEGTASAYPPSPVPGDDRLREGELPFTAFGQFGPGWFDLRVFDQDMYWVDQHGFPHLIAGMSAAYRYAVLRMLDDRAAEFHAAVSGHLAVQALDDLRNGEPNGDLLALALGVPFPAHLEPRDWLESTPLMRRLRRLVLAEGEQ